MSSPDARTSMYYDYSNLIKVVLTTGIATREPVPAVLVGLAPGDFADLSGWDPSLGFTGLAWWPEENGSAPLGEYQRYGTEETLTADFARKVVVYVRPVVSWTAEEIRADIEPKIVNALRKTDIDTDAFYKGYFGRRGTELAQVERVARTFAAGGYTGTIPPSVAAVMTRNATGEAQSAQWAADTIIAQADARNVVMESVYANRNSRQVEIKAANVNNELNSAVASWESFMDQLCGQLHVQPSYDY